MALHRHDLWTWRGPLGRADYAKWGLLLFLIKYNLDRAVALWGFDRNWQPWNYLNGAGSSSDLPLVRSDDANLLGILLCLSLPFIMWGVLLTLRRLRDAGWPAALVGLFFIPFVNLLFFAFLCLQPSRDPTGAEPAATGRWRRFLGPDNLVLAATLGGLVASVLLGLGLTVFGSVFLQHYGWGLFVGTPFMMGFFSALFYSLPRVRTLKECLLVAAASVGLLSLLLVLLAVEGIFCIAMAAPMGLVLALLGAVAGWAVQLERWSRRLDQVRLYAAAWVLAPLLLVAESRAPGAPPTFATTTICEISAPADVVWRHVVAFGELPRPTERLFLAGIAYPMRARIDGTGVGAVRYCEFSTGPFVEPITAWVEPRRLAFDVRSQPHPMREWSPYASLEPAHLEGFFRSRRGEFRLIPLPGGRTRLEGTTWYEQDIWPQVYWQPWSDYLIHTIHRRVLQHIKAEAERAAS